LPALSQHGQNLLACAQRFGHVTVPRVEVASSVYENADFCKGPKLQGVGIARSEHGSRGAFPERRSQVELNVTLLKGT
jgi:hypothetical protein